MVKPKADVRVRLKMKDPVTSLERALEQARVEDVALAHAHAGIVAELFYELTPAGSEVIDDHNLDTF